ncbi:MAG TPA: universal stress protein, partial [Thermoanaerobaculia bacterium]|nr:universal stress protein [Thermoanaerobaculia bacterium]
METVTFRRILMPTDFSDLAGMAIPWAKAIAGRSGAEIEVIYADPFLPPPYFTAAHLEEAVAQLSRSRELAEDELERYVAEEFGDGFTARAAVVESLPVQAIAEWSERNETDLIIMGT